MRKVNQSSDIIFCFMYFVWIFTGFKNYLGSGFFNALKMFMIKTFFRNVFLLLFLVKQRKHQRIIWLYLFRLIVGVILNIPCLKKMTSPFKDFYVA